MRFLNFFSLVAYTTLTLANTTISAALAVYHSDCPYLRIEEPPQSFHGLKTVKSVGPPCDLQTIQATGFYRMMALEDVEVTFYDQKHLEYTNDRENKILVSGYIREHASQDWHFASDLIHKYYVAPLNMTCYYKHFASLWADLKDRKSDKFYKRMQVTVPYDYMVPIKELEKMIMEETKLSILCTVVSDEGSGKEYLLAQPSYEKRFTWKKIRWRDLLYEVPSSIFSLGVNTSFVLSGIHWYHSPSDPVWIVSTSLSFVGLLATSYLGNSSYVEVDSRKIYWCGYFPCCTVFFPKVCCHRLLRKLFSKGSDDTKTDYAICCPRQNPRNQISL
ncbi:MAG: hypothetical protein AAF335_03630 [Bacteroidota bacterium]